MRAWVIGAAGRDMTRRFEAPIEIAGWERRPWVLLRPLTAREALRRESLGMTEEHEIGPDGAVRSVRRRYDHEAMMEFELAHCVVDYGLPVEAEDGGIVELTPAEAGPGELLGRLPTALMAWLAECLHAINMRRAEDAEVLAEAKKG